MPSRFDSRTVLLAAVSGLFLTALSLAADKPPTIKPLPWDQAAAAKYLDYREAWWQGWPPAQRDNGTTCVSCHTVLPYALARPALRKSLGEEPSDTERMLFNNVQTRVELWSKVAPYYKDAQSGHGKAVQSRATESVLNAFILASYDARHGRMRAITRRAFDAAWALQLRDGPNQGAWNWQVFRLAPWESSESQYQGATFMALALGMEPDDYKDSRAISDHVRFLRSYLTYEYGHQPMLNQIVVLWASANLTDLLTPKQCDALIAQIRAKQQSDGGWSLSSLGSWRRSDHTPLPTTSDGYATGVVVLALERAASAGNQDVINKGLAWLVAHQDRDEGSWHTSSLNQNRDPKSDVGRFMSDAATGYAVLALENCR